MPDDEQLDEANEATEASPSGSSSEGDSLAETAPEGAPAPEPEPEDDGSGEGDAAATPTVASEHQEMFDVLSAQLGDAIIEAGTNYGDLVVRVRRDAWHRAGEVARARLDCEYLSFISAIDWLPREMPPTEDPSAPSFPVQPPEMTFGFTGSDGRFQVFAVVESTDRKRQIILKTDLDESDPRVDSWVDLYPGADWHERETWEMFGIAFDGHPHLRHLYLPGEFEGHPLRKDFPLLPREVKPWPGLVDVETMPTEGGDGDGEAPAEGSAEPVAATTEGGDAEA